MIGGLLSENSPVRSGQKFEGKKRIFSKSYFCYDVGIKIKYKTG
jgi:hypothetical protein